MFDVHMCFFGILCADPSVRWLSAYTQGTLPVSLGVITLIKSGFHWASCLMLQVSGSLLNLLFCFCIATLYNICMLKSIYCLHFPFPFPFFLMGGRGQSQRDYLDMGYNYKIKGHIEGPSFKDTKGNAYLSDSL